MAARGTALPLVTLLLSSCAGPEPAVPVGIGTVCAGTVELGVGLHAFAPLQDGDTVTLEGLPTGLWIVVYAARATGLGDDLTACVRQELAATGELFGLSCWRLPWTDVGDGWLERRGLWGEIDESFEVRLDALRGQEALVELVVTSASGCQASDLRRVTLE